MSQSKDEGEFNFLSFNLSPRYPNSLLDKILIRTPRINSPSAFTIYNGASTAHSYVPFGNQLENGK